MDGHLGGEARTSRGGAFGGEPLVVPEVGVDRVDRRGIGRRGGQQTERSRNSIDIVVDPVYPAVVAAESG
jgi:hypothetical protein